MKQKIYICSNCGKKFEYPIICEERHRLDRPPFEKYMACSGCGMTSFEEFELTVDKLAVAEKLLKAIAAFNRYWYSIADIYGVEIENADFFEGTNQMKELIDDMFNFISIEKEKEISSIQTDGEIERIIEYLG